MSAAVSILPHGLHSSIPFGDYKAIPADNFSKLKEAVRSPLHYKHRLDNAGETTGAMRLGTAAHTAVLEPHRFDTDYVLWDERDEKGEVRRRAGKLWDAFVAANPGKNIIRRDELDTAMAIRDAVHCHPRAGFYLKAGEPEVTMLWEDPETKRTCKGRVDWLNGRTLLGLKTARDCRNVGFGNQAARLGCAIQWALYHDGFEALTGHAPKVVEVVVESFAPYDVAVFTIPDEILDVGRAEYRQIQQQIADCEREDHWPGSCPLEQVLTFPSWKFHAEEDIAVLGFES